MATTYTKTDNLGLNLYGDNDPADLRDGYNSSMRKIDSTVKANTDAIVTKADASDVADKLALKADKSDVYTKTESDTALALKANVADVVSRYTNVVELGADNTGASDTADKLQSIVDGNPYGVYFPAGVYHISHPIIFPYNTPGTYGISLSQGATIVATEVMDEMFLLGGKDCGRGSEKEGFSISGGNFNANDKAAICIKTSSNIRQSRISNVDVRYFTSVGIYVDVDPSPDLSKSSDTLVNNVRINRVQTPHHLPNTQGIFFAGGDNIVELAYIADCATGIKSIEFLQVGTVHIFGDYYWYGHTNNKTCGISCKSIFAHSLYMDSLDVAVESTGNCLIDSFYMYNYFQASGRVYFRVIDNKLEVNILRVEGYTTGDRYIQFINSDLSLNDNLDSRYRIHSEINPTMITDGASLTNKDTTYRRVAFRHQTNIPAFSGILVGYVTKTSDSALGGAVFTFSTESGFEFYVRAFIHAMTDAYTTTNRYKINAYESLADGTKGIAIGVPENIGLSDKFTAYPVYVYNKYDWANIPDFYVKAEFPSQFNAGIIYDQGESPKIVPLTTSNTIATTQDGGAL